MSDAITLLHENRVETAYFSVEHGDLYIEVAHVVTDVEGFFIRWVDPASNTSFEAIGATHPSGLALAYDGGGEPLIIDRACVLGFDEASRVVRAFEASGTRDASVRWGRGVVFSYYSFEPGWELLPLGAAGTLSGAYAGEVGGEVDDAIDSASWRVLSVLTVHSSEWLSALVTRPITGLRSLRLNRLHALDLGDLIAAIAALPALTELIVVGSVVLEWPELVSPTLEKITLAPVHEDFDEDEALPEGGSARFAKRSPARRCPGFAR